MGLLSKTTTREQGIQEHFDQAMDLVGKGQVDSALQQLRGLTSQTQCPVNILEATWRLAKEANRFDMGMGACVRLIQHNLKRRKVQQAYFLWREGAHATRRSIPVNINLKLVDQLLASNMNEEAEHVIRLALQRLTQRDHPMQIVDLVERAVSAAPEALDERADTLKSLPQLGDLELERIRRALRTARAQSQPAAIAVSSAPETDSRSQGANVRLARAEQMVAWGINLVDESGQRLSVSYTDIRGVAIAGVREPSQKPYLIVDLIMDANSVSVLRLMSTHFNARRLYPEIQRPIDGFIRFAREVAQQASAPRFPADRLTAETLPVFEALSAYENALSDAAHSLS